jgi:hypothetical protein
MRHDRNALFWSRDRDLVLKVRGVFDLRGGRRLASVDSHVRRSYARSSHPWLSYYPLHTYLAREFALYSWNLRSWNPAVRHCLWKKLLIFIASWTSVVQFASSQCLTWYVFWRWRHQVHAKRWPLCHNSEDDNPGKFSSSRTLKLACRCYLLRILLVVPFIFGTCVRGEGF